MSDTDTIEAATDLAIIPASALPTILAADKDDILGKLRAELQGRDPDATTPKGRDEIRSAAFKPRKAKAAIERLAATLKEDAQKTIRDLNAELKAAVTGLDALSEALRKPLDDYEAIENARTEEHETALRSLASVSEGVDGLEVAAIDARLSALDTSPLLSRDWQEYRERAKATLQATVNALKAARADAKEREEAAERARLELLRLQAEREVEIARQAAETARLTAEEAARVEAVRVAQEAAEREAAIKREQARIEREAREAADAAEVERVRILTEARLGRERADAEIAAGVERERVAAERAERERVSAHDKALDTMTELGSNSEGVHAVGLVDARLTRLAEVYARDWQEYAEAAAEIHGEVFVCLTDQRARSVEAERIANERRQAEATARAIEADRQRIADEAAETDRQNAIRAANKAHQTKINGDALIPIMAAITKCFEKNEVSQEAIGRAVIVAIAKGLVPHIRIEY